MQEIEKRERERESERERKKDKRKGVVRDLDLASTQKNKHHFAIGETKS